MKTLSRSVVMVALASAWTIGVLFAQAPGAPAGNPAPAPQGQAPAGPTPAGQAPAGQAPAGRGAAPGRGRGAGPRAGGFTMFTRPLPSQDVIVRGKALYDATCASCHAPDLRGSMDRKIPNVLAAGASYRDQNGELIAAAAAKHTPPLTLVPADAAAVSGYIHSVQATMGGGGSPPPVDPAKVNPLVGDARAGQATFQTTCGSCHSVTGDLKGIGSKFADVRALQGGWVAGATSTFAAAGGGGRGGRGGGAGEGLPATVTLANGSKVDGTLVSEGNFLIVITLPDGTRKAYTRTNGVPSVVVKDPKAPHVNAIVKLAQDDKTSKMMHDITAYLWTIK